MTVHRLMLVFVMFVMFGGSAAAAPWPEASGTTDGMPVARSADKRPTIKVQEERNNVVLKVTNPTSVMFEPLPTSLGQALTVMERSELVAETLGEHVYDHFLRNKRQEWADYRRQVTPFELARYLPVL